MQEAYHPPRSKHTLCCSGGGGGVTYPGLLPTLAGGYLPWLGGTYPGRGGTYPGRWGTYPGVPTLARGVPTLAGGTYHGRYPPPSRPGKVGTPPPQPDLGR